MLAALSNERNVTLIAPWRIGKAGLIKNVFYQMQQLKADVACFYMDIFATRDLTDFVHLLAKTVLGQLDTLSESVLHKLTSFFRSCRPLISADELTGVPTVSLDFVADKSEQTLKEIFDYMEASGRRCYLAIDEKAPSSVNTALKSLLEKELIYKSAGGYIVYDRFMGMWMQTLA